MIHFKRWDGLLLFFRFVLYHYLILAHIRLHLMPQIIRDYCIVILSIQLCMLYHYCNCIRPSKTSSATCITKWITGISLQMVNETNGLTHNNQPPSPIVYCNRRGVSGEVDGLIDVGQHPCSFHPIYSVVIANASFVFFLPRIGDKQNFLQRNNLL